MLRPIGDKVVVRRLAAETVTRGGIVIPEAAREKQLRGEVLAVGPGRVLDNGQRIPPSVKPGDVVLVGRYAGTEVERRGQHGDYVYFDDGLLVCRDDDLLAVVVEE